MHACIYMHTFLERVICGGVPEKLTFEQPSKGGKEDSHVMLIRFLYCNKIPEIIGL